MTGGASSLGRVPDQSVVRARNLAAVAALVRTRGTVSRREVHEALALNKATVSSLVGELVERGLVEPGEQRHGVGPGRRTTSVRVDRTLHASVVVEILAEQVRISVWTLEPGELRHHTHPCAPAAEGPERALPRVGAALRETLGELAAEGRTVAGVAVALPGIVESRTGRLLRSEPLGWEDVDVVAVLTAHCDLTGVPLLVSRIANLATLAEWRALPPGPDCVDLICLHAGATGLGAGVVVDGRLLTGAHGRAGELLLPLPDLRAAAFDGGAAARRFADALGTRLATLVALLDPSVVVLAGRLAPLLQTLRPGLEDTLAAALAPRPAADLELRAGSLTGDSAARGGALLVADGLFQGLHPG